MYIYEQLHWLSKPQWRINASDTERADIQTIALTWLLSKITFKPLALNTGKGKMQQWFYRIKHNLTEKMLHKASVASCSPCMGQKPSRTISSYGWLSLWRISWYSCWSNTCCGMSMSQADSVCFKWPLHSSLIFTAGQFVYACMCVESQHKLRRLEPAVWFKVTCLFGSVYTRTSGWVGFGYQDWYKHTLTHTYTQTSSVTKPRELCRWYFQIVT